MSVTISRQNYWTDYVIWYTDNLKKGHRLHFNTNSGMKGGVKGFMNATQRYYSMRTKLAQLVTS